MPAFYPTSCDPGALSKLANCCGVGEGSGVRHLLLVDYSYDATTFRAAMAAATANTDPSAAVAAADAALTAAVAAGKVIKFYNVVGSFSQEPQMSPGYGGQAERFVGYTNTLTVKTIDAPRNEAFYDGLNRSVAYVPYFATATQMWADGNKASVVCTLEIPEAYNDEVKVNVQMKSQGKSMPVAFVMPSDIGNCSTVDGFFVASTSGTATSIARGASGNRTITVTRTDCTDTLALALISPTALPSGVTFGTITGLASGSTVTIPINVAGGAATGDTVITVRLTGCGESVPVTFTLTVT